MSVLHMACSSMQQLRLILHMMNSLSKMARL
jgi:hypothetical protein